MIGLLYQAALLLILMTLTVLFHVEEQFPFGSTVFGNICDQYLLELPFAGMEFSDKFIF